MAALLQRIEAALAGITPGEWEWNHRYELHNKREAVIAAELNANRYPVMVVKEADAELIAAAPALLRECAALLRGLDDGAVGELRQKWDESVARTAALSRNPFTSTGTALEAMATQCSNSNEYIAAIEADNVRLREALAAAEAELRQYREPM